MPLVARQDVITDPGSPPDVGSFTGASTAAPPPTSLAPSFVIDPNAPADTAVPPSVTQSDAFLPPPQSSGRDATGAEQTVNAEPHGATTSTISIGTIIGACVGSFALLVLILIFAFWVIRKQPRRLPSSGSPRTPYSDKEKDRRKSHAEFWHRLDDVLPDRRRPTTESNDLWERERQGNVHLRNAAASPTPSPAAISFQEPHIPQTVHIESWGGDTAIGDSDEHWKKTESRYNPNETRTNRPYDSFLSFKSVSPNAPLSELPPPHEQSSSTIEPHIQHPFASPAATVSSHKAQGSEMSAIDKLIAALEIDTPRPRSPESDYLSTRSFPMPPSIH